MITPDAILKMSIELSQLKIKQLLFFHTQVNATQIKIRNLGENLCDVECRCASMSFKGVVILIPRTSKNIIL